MARHVEEEENHWPGFVDALSTIVMVVTFLLIILGVAIFAISTQVTKAVSQSQAEASALTKASAEMTASIEQKTQDAKTAEDKANAAVSALATAIELQASAEAAEKAAEDKLAAASAPSPAASEPPPPPNAASSALSQAQQTIAEQQKQIEAQKQAAADLARQIATLNQAAPKAQTQDQAVKADNQLMIDSRKTIDPAEIKVAAQEDATQSKAVTVQSAAEVLTVRFEDGAIRLDDGGATQTIAFVKQNAAAIAGRKLSLWAFYDNQALGLTQAKRSAYFRVLALRNAMIDAGLDTGTIDVSVRPAGAPEEVDTVKAFLQ